MTFNLCNMISNILGLDFLVIHFRSQNVDFTLKVVDIFLRNSGNTFEIAHMYFKQQNTIRIYASAIQPWLDIVIVNI